MARTRRTKEEIESQLELTMRTCRKCGEEQHISEYRKRPFADGFHTQCKTCTDENSEQHRQENIEKRKSQDRARNLRNKFGITIEQYNELLEKQNHCCAICDRHEDEFKTRMAVDHNHATGEIRGLLCTYCNHRVIGRHRNGDMLRKMADYVDQGTGWFVPKKKRPVKRKPKRN